MAKYKEVAIMLPRPSFTVDARAKLNTYNFHMTFKMPYECLI